MKRLALLVVCLLALSLPAWARQRYFGYCSQGGVDAATYGSLLKLETMGSYPGSTVTVFDAGTANVSTIFSDNAGTAKANPFTTDSTTGFFSFYSNDGRYDVRCSGTGITTPFTWGDVLLDDGAGVWTVETVAFVGSPTFDASKSSIFVMTLTGNVTSSTVTGAVTGKVIAFQLCQDGTGGRTFAWPASFLRPPVIASSANACTNQAFYYEGTNWRPLAASGDNTQARVLNNLWFADQQASTSAAFTGAGTGGGVVFPPNYTIGTFTNSNNRPVLDFTSIAWRGFINVKDFGAVGDGRASTHVSTTASNTTLTDTMDSPWVAADVGKTIVLYSQTYAGQVTTITAFTDSAHVVVAAAPTSTTTVNAVWGTDDSAAITSAFAAMTATAASSHLYFPAGIYLMGTAVSVVNAQGLMISGAGAATAISLGNYNVSPQPATGSALVWIGAVGGVIGCASNTGSPPAGIDNAATNCTAAENVMLKLSGGFHLHDLALIGTQRASHNLQVGGTEASSSFNWSIDHMNSAYARQYGLVIGGTGADQGVNCCHGNIDQVQIGTNGLPNTTVAENDATGGGQIFFRISAGNFSVKVNTAFLGGGSGPNGNHHVFAYTGNFLAFDNVYFAPLTANSTIHSSFFSLLNSAGNKFTFDNIYDENGYMIHATGGDQFELRQVQMRQQTTTNPHVAAVFENTPEVSLSGVSTAGLPLVFKAGAKLTRNRVVFGNFGAGPAYPATLCAGAGCITRSGSTVTLTTTATHPYLASDWVTLSGIADATYNGTFQVTTPITGTTFTVTNAAAVGASTEGGTAGLACCVISETATSYMPQYSHPFINYLDGQNNSGTLADQLAGTATNIAHKNAITMIHGSTSGAVGSSLPATIPAGWQFLDFRGGYPAWFGPKHQWGSTANPSELGVNGAPVATVALSIYNPTGGAPLYTRSTSADATSIFMDTDSGAIARLKSGNAGSTFWSLVFSHGATKTFNIQSPTKQFLSADDTNSVLTLGNGVLGVSIGTGASIIKHLSGTASLDFTALAANTCEVLTITVTGAADGNTVTLGVPTALADVDGATERTTFFGWVSATNTVSVRRCNVTAGATAEPAAATVRADVWVH